MKTLGAGPLKLVFVPSGNFAWPDLLPPVRMHAFHHRRIKNAGDDLPEYLSYWPSDFALTTAAMKF